MSEIEHALNELRALSGDDVSLALLPNILANGDGTVKEIWQVVDIWCFATVMPDGGFEEAVVGTGDSVQDAVRNAREAF